MMEENSFWMWSRDMINEGDAFTVFLFSKQVQINFPDALNYFFA